jgi:hypothetical protein
MQGFGGKERPRIDNLISLQTSYVTPQSDLTPAGHHTTTYTQYPYSPL